MTTDAPAERYELLPGQTLTLEVRRDPVLWTGLVLAVAAVLIALVALALAVKAEPAPAATSAGTVAAAPAAYRGPAVVRHKARQCYTIRNDAGRVVFRKCTVRWVHDVRTRTTLEQFRARVA